MSPHCNRRVGTAFEGDYVLWDIVIAGIVFDEALRRKVSVFRRDLFPSRSPRGGLLPQRLVGQLHLWTQILRPFQAPEKLIVPGFPGPGVAR